MTDVKDSEWKHQFAGEVIDLHKSVLDRGLHPLQAWAEMNYLIKSQKKRNEETDD